MPAQKLCFGLIFSKNGNLTKIHR